MTALLPVELEANVSQCADQLSASRRVRPKTHHLVAGTVSVRPGRTYVCSHANHLRLKVLVGDRLTVRFGRLDPPLDRFLDIRDCIGFRLSLADTAGQRRALGHPVIVLASM